MPGGSRPRALDDLEGNSERAKPHALVASHFDPTHSIRVVALLRRGFAPPISELVAFPAGALKKRAAGRWTGQRDRSRRGRYCVGAQMAAVTTAAEDWSDEQRRCEPVAGLAYRCVAEATGLPVPAFRPDRGCWEDLTQ